MENASDGDRGLPQSGPLSYINWREAREHVPSKGAAETALYTDAHVTGEVTSSDQPGDLNLGPYMLLNTVPWDLRQGPLRASVVLRAENHLPDLAMSAAEPWPTSTDESWYTGGVLQDEMAALLSLALGARFKAGGIIREFRPGGDERGHPCANWGGHEPEFTRPPLRLIIPQAAKKCCLNDATLLEGYPAIEPRGAVALVRAAKSYQHGLWIAEAEPALAWLSFVSAVEIAANHWYSGDLDPMRLFRENKPVLAEKLAREGGEGILKTVAMEFAPTMRSTHKFIKFLQEFLPEPPSQRPPELAQIEWSRKGIERIARVVYEHRSKALHAGKPVPLPICEAPFRHPDWGAPAEKIWLGPVVTWGAAWQSNDLPPHLHVFEIIVRGSLQNWWRGLSEQS